MSIIRKCELADLHRKDVDRKTLSETIPKLIASLPEEEQYEMWVKAIRMIRGEEEG